MHKTPEKFLLLDSVNSTNNYAMGLISRGEAVDTMAIFSREQTAGKGRRGKEWKSNKGENILLSIIADMQWFPLRNQFQLSVAVALGCVDFFDKYLPGKAFIKWPNDLFINDRKAGGVLIENVVKGTLWQWSVVGIGLNVNQLVFEELPVEGISLKLLTGLKFDPVLLAKELQACVLRRLAEIKEGNFTKRLMEYNGRLFGKCRTVKVKKGAIVFNTTVTGVSPAGKLLTKDAVERSFDFDEIEFKEWL